MQQPHAAVLSTRRRLCVNGTPQAALQLLYDITPLFSRRPIESLNTAKNC